jgi:hypothetical protein
MTNSRYAVDRRVGAPPDAVLAALRDALAAARPADVPRTLRTEVRGLRGKARGQRFTLRLEERSDGDVTDLRGWVLPAEEGEARVHARAVDDRNAGWAVLALLGVASAFWLLGGGGAWMMAGMAAFLAIIAVVRHAGGFISHERAGYLVHWLNGVLDQLPPPSPAPPTSPGEPVPSAREA